VNPVETSASTTSTEHLRSNETEDQKQWPQLYSNMENMSLNEPRRQERFIMSMSLPVEKYDDISEVKPCPTTTTNSRCEKNSTNTCDQSSLSYSETNNPFCRQTLAKPCTLETPTIDDRLSIQSTPAYFGRGSHVGRGRPMTNDR
jgi:hypothetical protein